MKLFKTFFTDRSLYCRYKCFTRKKERRLDRIIVALFLMDDGLTPSVIKDACKALNIERNKTSYRLINELYRAHIVGNIDEDLIKRIPL